MEFYENHIVEASIYSRSGRLMNRFRAGIGDCIDIDVQRNTVTIRTSSGERRRFTGFPFTTVSRSMPVVDCDVERVAQA